MTLGRAAVAVVVLFGILSIGVLGGLLIILRTWEQAERTQLHVDCAITLLSGTTPPECAATIEELRRAGFLHPVEP